MKFKSLMFSLCLFAISLIVIVDYIYLQHRTRNQFVELQTLVEQEHSLNADWGRLQIEHSTYVNNSIVEATAKKQLGMILPESEHILSIKR